MNSPITIEGEIMRYLLFLLVVAISFPSFASEDCDYLVQSTAANMNMADPSWGQKIYRLRQECERMGAANAAQLDQQREMNQQMIEQQQRNQMMMNRPTVTNCYRSGNGVQCRTN